MGSRLQLHNTAHGTTAAVIHTGSATGTASRSGPRMWLDTRWNGRQPIRYSHSIDNTF